MLLLARLGIRAGEVIRLRIDDIDWVRGCVLVRAGKTHRERSLPLSQEVGDALVLYLRQSRPVSPHRELVPAFDKALALLTETLPLPLIDQIPVLDQNGSPRRF